MGGKSRQIHIMSDQNMLFISFEYRKERGDINRYVDEETCGWRRVYR